MFDRRVYGVDDSFVLSFWEGMAQGTRLDFELLYDGDCLPVEGHREVFLPSQCLLVLPSHRM